MNSRTTVGPAHLFNLHVDYPDPREYGAIYLGSESEPLALEGPPLGSWSSHDKCGQCDGVEVGCCYSRMLLTGEQMLPEPPARSSLLRRRQQAFDRCDHRNHRRMFLCAWNSR